MGIQPFPVGLSGSIVLLDLIISDHPACHRIHQQHLSRMQPFFYQNLRRLYIHYSYFRCKDQRIILCNQIPGRTKAVSIQHRPHHIPVGKHNGSRTVPGLHHGRIVLVKVPLFPAHGSVVRPGLGNRDHHRQRQIHPAHHQKFQRIVQHRGIRTGSIDDRQHLPELVF